jgi:hypothetical protein
MLLLAFKPRDEFGACEWRQNRSIVLLAAKTQFVGEPRAVPVDERLNRGQRDVFVRILADVASGLRVPQVVFHSVLAFWCGGSSIGSISPVQQRFKSSLSPRTSKCPGSTVSSQVMPMPSGMSYRATNLPIAGAMAACRRTPRQGDCVERYRLSRLTKFLIPIDSSWLGRPHQQLNLFLVDLEYPTLHRHDRRRADLPVP